MYTYKRFYGKTKKDVWILKKEVQLDIIGMPTFKHYRNVVLRLLTFLGMEHLNCNSLCIHYKRREEFMLLIRIEEGSTS